MRYRAGISARSASLLAALLRRPVRRQAHVPPHAQDAETGQSRRRDPAGPDGLERHHRHRAAPAGAAAAHAGFGRRFIEEGSRSALGRRISGAFRTSSPISPSPRRKTSARRPRTCSSAASARRISESGAEGGVAFYVDGVYLPRSLGLLMNLTDVDRIEVLRGPQGTLYGKDAIGGAINVISTMPGPDRERRRERHPRQLSAGANCARWSTSRCPTGCSCGWRSAW